MPPSIRLYEQTGKAGKSPDEALILENLGMVKRIAVHLKARIPPFMEVDELVQVGMIGLIEAARAFDPTKGVAFESYAHSRVRGAMIDEVRRLSFLPRSAVAFNKSHSTANQALASELGRAPTQAELAEYMGVELDSFEKDRGNARQFETYSMEVVTDEVMNLPDQSSRQPDAIVEEAQMMEALTDAIDQLPERDKLVISLYYVEELNLREIGEVLGVSESRVSQILSANVKKLRTQLKSEPRTR
jgi:RNA polymerase sigma factor for flagellar operon FliA